MQRHFMALICLPPPPPPLPLSRPRAGGLGNLADPRQNMANQFAARGVSSLLFLPTLPFPALTSARPAIASPTNHGLPTVPAYSPPLLSLFSHFVKLTSHFHLPPSFVSTFPPAPPPPWLIG